MFSHLPSGFTLDLSKYLLSKTRTMPLVDSSYDLGLVFGAFAEGGVAHMHNSPGVYHVGSVRWYVPDTRLEFAQTLAKAITSATTLKSSYRYHTPKSRKVYAVLCYSNALSRMFSEFDQGEDKHIPEKYIVNHPGFLSGIVDGVAGVIRAEYSVQQQRHKPLVDSLVIDIVNYLSIDVPDHVKRHIPIDTG